MFCRPHRTCTGIIVLHRVTWLYDNTMPSSLVNTIVGGEWSWSGYLPKQNGRRIGIFECRRVRVPAKVFGGRANSRGGAQNTTKPSRICVDPRPCIYVYYSALTPPPLASKSVRATLSILLCRRWTVAIIYVGRCTHTRCESWATVRRSYHDTVAGKQLHTLVSMNVMGWFLHDNENSNKTCKFLRGGGRKGSGGRVPARCGKN